MIARSLRNRWVVLALGVLMLAVALIPRGGDVKCGTQVMRPGETCQHTTDGNPTGAYSYAEQKADQSRTSTAIGWLGGAVTLGAIGWIVYSMRRRPEMGLTVVSPIS